jgi:hypothetical protein
MDYSSTALIAQVKRFAALPTNQNMFQDADFIAILASQLRTYITPLVMKVKEEYFVTSSTQAITSGTTTYPIPPDAVGGKLRSVQWRDASNNILDLPRLSIEQISTDLQVVRPYGYTIEGDNIVLYPTPLTTATLKMYYYRRPNELVLESDAAKIISANGTTGELICVAVPTTWTTASVLDAIDGKQGFGVLSESVTISSIAGTSVFVSPAVAALLEANDYVSLHNTSPIPQIPVEAFDLLVQAGVVKCLESLSDGGDGTKLAAEQLMKMEEMVINLLTNRVESSPKKIVNNRGIWKSYRTWYWGS